MDEDEIVSIVFDAVQYRPACVLLQSMMGGQSNVVSEYFPADTWLLNPNSDMRRYTGTRADMQRVADKCKRLFGENKDEQ